MTDVGKEVSNIFLDFLCSLPVSEVDQLLSIPSSAFFVFRLLPTVAQQLVIKIIWNSNVIDSLKMEKEELVESLQILKRLHLVISEEERLKVNFRFRRAYLKAVMTGSQRCANIQSTEMEDKKKNKDISKKSYERWECILRYLALPSEQNMANVSITTRKLFKSAGFTNGDEGDIEITSSGFQFLLLSPVQQMWAYMTEYLKLQKSEGKDLLTILGILIRIVLCVDKGDDTSKRAYELDNAWTELENEVVTHMRELGLIFIRKRKDGVFFLTPLLWNLSTGTDQTSTSEERKEGMIIVETNFRLYAYTSSNLQLAILSTFTEMTYRFHDMSVGMLSRESVRRALQVGITASQIISYLRANAHPKCLASGGPFNCLPITVADQIRLWEDERKRLVFTDAVMYSTFETENEFVGVRDVAVREDVLLWADSDRKLVIVNEEGHNIVKQWWKQRSQ